MEGKTFVDTNVLIYGHDLDAKDKHEIAKTILVELWGKRTGLLSMQVLQEFYVNITRKISSPMPRQSARAIVSNYMLWCPEPDSTDIARAFAIEDQARIGFWDALIVASALRSGAVRLLSEDLNPGQTIAGIRVENPFSRSR